LSRSGIARDRERRPSPAVLLLALLLACGGRPGREVTIDPLPGAPPWEPALRARIAAAVAAEGHAAPRTRHLRPDGSPRYTNRLILESSPYLLQHAHNPVDWYPWGDEAFARAAAEGRPVLLSVGYATCHWCHVMEEESFEDEAIAEYLNRNYVAIKVDREVRPDVDDAYLRVVEALTGGGGWPMTVWLTPTREAFAGTTYLPPQRFLSSLQDLRQAFETEPLRVATQASMLTARVQATASTSSGDELPGAPVLREAFGSLAEAFDAEHGGFGGAPKFPSPAELEFLLRYHRRTASAPALAMVTRTLERMAAGGIHDQIGGGFHRYAIDAAWQVPHFEKTLADNAQLASVYVAAWQVTRREDFAAVARDVLDWLGREMTAPGGGLYAATDADSDGEEGRFYVWTPAQIRDALDAPHADAVIAYFGVTEQGNFRGRTILHVERPLEETAAALAVTPEVLRGLIAEAQPVLLAARARRARPATDTKVVTAWNGLAISAFARAGAAFADPGYVEHARAAARFVLDRMRVEGRLRRSHAGGVTSGDGFLEDHAFVVRGLLDLYEATFDLAWLDEAIALQNVLEADFRDEQGGGFYQTRAGAEAPLGRRRPEDDGPTPSGNAVAAENLLRLAEFTGHDGRRAEADAVLRALAPRLERAPADVPALCGVLESRLDRAKEIVIVQPPAGGGSGELLAVVRRTYLPNRVLTVAREGEETKRQARIIPLVGDKRALGGAATAYVCEERVCRLPTSDPVVLAAQLAAVRALDDGTTPGTRDP
jgi:uncharacterized protein YyaL (SSP411 family)